MDKYNPIYYLTPCNIEKLKIFPSKRTPSLNFVRPRKMASIKSLETIYGLDGNGKITS